MNALRSAILVFFATALWLGSLIAAAWAVSVKSNTPITIRGAGSTFASLLYAKWINAFSRTFPNVTINYDAVGSDECSVQRRIEWDRDGRRVGRIGLLRIFVGAVRRNRRDRHRSVRGHLHGDRHRLTGMLEDSNVQHHAACRTYDDRLAVRHLMQQCL